MINENDSVATAEIRFGDNDRLAARVAEMVQADQLVLLSDIDGLYTADPRARPRARSTSRWWPRSPPEIEAMGGEPPPGYSSGGMRTKLVAARIATGAGCAMAIAVGHVEPPAARAGGGRALHLVPAGAGGPLGPQALDRRHAGAARQLHRRCRRGARAGRGRSLLPAGVRGGRRQLRPRRRGGGARPGRARRWRAGCRPMPAPTRRASSATAAIEIEAILGWRGRDELIHRDDLVLL